MKKKIISKSNQDTSRFLYYGMRSAQRITLLMVGLLTFIYWATVISVTVSLVIVQQQKDVTFEKPQELNQTVNRAVDTITAGALRWAVLAAVASAALLMIVRVRKNEKRLVVDSMIFVIFCLLSIMLAQPIIRAFISQIAT